MTEFPSLPSSLVPSMRGRHDLIQAGLPGEAWRSRKELPCRHSLGGGVLCSVVCHIHEPGTLTVLTLGAHGLRDRAGLTEAPGSHSTHKEQIDGVGLQTTDRVCLQLHAICHCPPCVASCLAATGMG